MYRVEVRYDECGTTAEYSNGHSEIIFKNALTSKQAPIVIKLRCKAL